MARFGRAFPIQPRFPTGAPPHPGVAADPATVAGGAAAAPAGTHAGTGTQSAGGGSGMLAAGVKAAAGAAVIALGASLLTTGTVSGPSARTAGASAAPVGHRNAQGSATVRLTTTITPAGAKNGRGTGKVTGGPGVAPAGVHHGQSGPPAPTPVTASGPFSGVPGTMAPGAVSPGDPQVPGDTGTGDPFSGIPGAMVPGLLDPGDPQATTSSTTAAALWGITGTLTARPAGAHAAAGSAAAAAGGALRLDGTPGAPSSATAGATITAAGTKKATGAAQVTGTTTATPAGAKNGRGGGAVTGTAGASPAGTHQGQSAPLGVAGGLAAQPAGTHAGAGTAAASAGGVLLTPGSPGAPAAATAGASIRATGAKRATGTAQVGGASAATPAGAKNGRGSGAVTGSPGAAPAGVHHGQSGPPPVAATDPFSGIPAAAVPGMFTPGDPQGPTPTAPLWGITGTLTAQPAGTHASTGSASATAGAALYMPGSAGGPSATAAGAGIRVTGAKKAAGAAQVGATTAAAPAGTKDTRGGGAVTGTAGMASAGTHQGQSAPLGVAGGLAAQPAGTHAGAGSATATAAGALYTPGSPGAPAAATAGASIRAAGAKKAAGAAQVAGTTAATPAGAKNGRGVGKVTGGPAAAPAGVHHGQSGPPPAATTDPFSGIPAAMVPGMFTPGDPQATTPGVPLRGIAGTLTAQPAGTHGTTAAASVSAGAALYMPGSAGGPSAATAGASIRVTGVKKVTGAAKTGASAAAGPAGTHAGKGAAAARGGAAVPPAGVKAATTALVTAAGAAAAPTGVHQATAAASVSASAGLHMPGNPGGPSAATAGAAIRVTGVKKVTGAAKVAAGLQQVPAAHKTVRSAAAVRGGAQPTPTGAHAGKGAAAYRAGGSSAAAGVKAASGPATVRATGSLAAANIGTAIQITRTWTDAWTAPLNPGGAPPATAPSLVITGLGNTPGRWLFAVVAWRQAPGYPPVEFSVADGRNWWDPQGAPGGTSDATGTLRIAVWRAPAARAVASLAASPTGFVLSAALTVIEIDPLAPWVTEAPTVTAFAAAATSLPLAPAAPGGPAVWFTAVARGLNSVTTTYPSGWTPGPMASTSNGLDDTGDLTLQTAFRQQPGAPAPTWAGNGPADMAGVATGVLIFATQPPQPNQSWAPAVLEIAPGAGVQTPAAETTWIRPDDGDITRFLDLTDTRGQQYEVGTTEAGRGSMTLNDPDLAITPPGLGVFNGIDSGTPWRVRYCWPGGGGWPANPSPWYVISGFFERLPPSWTPDTRRGQVVATTIDSWAYVQDVLKACLDQEMLADGPTHLWPLTDPQGSPYASNAAPGSNASLVQVPSRYGAGAATATFGQATVPLPGGAGAGWVQAGLPSVPTQTGWALYCQDSAFPPLNGTAGVTVESWFSLADTVMWQAGTVWAIKSSKGLVMRVLANADGTLSLQTQDIAGQQVTTSLGTATHLGAGAMTQVAVTWNTATGWDAYVNGTLAASSAATPALAPAFAWISAGGESDRFASGGTFDGQSNYLAVYPLVLPPARVAAHYWAGSAALAGEDAPSRVERLLGYAAWTGRRLVETSTITDQCSSASDINGAQAGPAMTNITVSTAPAMLYVATTGDIVFHPKGRSFGEPAVWALGEDVDTGEVPYLIDATFDWDPQRVINDIQITQLDRSDVVTPQVTALEAASQAQFPQHFTGVRAGLRGIAAALGRHGSAVYQVTGYLNNDLTTPVQSANPTNLIDLANWLAVTNATPHLRAAEITVDAATYPPAWPLVLGVNPGDMATFARRPITAQRQLGGTARITRVDRRIVFKDGGAVAQVKLALDFCPEAFPLTLDDPAAGQLTGGNVLTW